MIENYTIKHEHHEDVLYLYLNYNYEFGAFNKGKNFFQELKDFLNNKLINFQGNKIKLIVNGIVIGTIFLNNINIPNNHPKEYIKEPTYVNKVVLNDFLGEPEYIINVNEETDDNTSLKIQQEEIKKENITNKKNNNQDKLIAEDVTKDYQTIYPDNDISNSNPSSEETIEEPKSQQQVTIYRSNGSIINLELEEYLIGVVAGEMPASFHNEALKVQAVIARTYALKTIQRNKKLTDTSSTQVYIDNEQMKNKWGKDYEKYYNKIRQAVNDTEGLVIVYNNDYIDAVYFANSNGYTEDAKNVWGNDFPYLRSVESSWDINTNRYQSTKSFSYEEASNILGFTIDENVQIYNILRNNSHRISSITINDKSYTGIDIRNLFHLNSADFDIEINDNNLTFTTYGYGHGVGLSQYGANGMANNGYNFSDIIQYYYQGVTTKNTL